MQNSQGCTDTATATVAIIPAPIADFAPDGVCLHQTIIFADQSTFPGGIITTWTWDFGDGSPVAVIQNPSHLYTNVGTYPVKLIITSNTGCADTVIKNIVVHPLPHALFTSGNGCKGSIIPFTDQSTIANPDALSAWTWDFGDLSSLNNNQNTFHQYSNIGSFSASLLVISNFGCRDSITKTVTINPPYVLTFSAPDTTGCSPLCVNFHSQINMPAGSHASYMWDFGDGSPLGQTANPNHCYKDTSTTVVEKFTVTLTVSPDTGCISVLTKNNYIVVNPSPVAKFSADPNPASILNPTISFTNLSAGATAWNWNLGDLTTTNLNTPLPHTYADTGSYLVTLIDSNSFSCFDTARLMIFIEPDFSFYIPSAFSPNGNGINDNFQGYGYGIIDYEMFIFDRWGNEIYHTTDYTQPWNGKVNQGIEAELMDVYIYTFKIKDVKGKKHDYKGTITLVK